MQKHAHIRSILGKLYMLQWMFLDQGMDFLWYHQILERIMGIFFLKNVLHFYSYWKHIHIMIINYVLKNIMNIKGIVSGPYFILAELL